MVAPTGIEPVTLGLWVLRRRKRIGRAAPTIRQSLESIDESRLQTANQKLRKRPRRQSSPKTARPHGGVRAEKAITMPLARLLKS